MRVAVVSRIYRPEPAAASFWLASVVEILTERGHDVDVLTSALPRGGSDPAPGAERVLRFRVLRDRSGYVRGYLPYLSFDVPLAFRLLFLRRPSVVLVEPPPTTGAVVRVVCALRRIPYVYDAADVWSDAADMATASGTVVRVLRAVERFAMNGAARLVTISQGVVDRVSALGVHVPATVTGFGADTSAFTVGDAATEPLFVYAGSYSAWHGADVLVPAFAEFLATHPGYTLRFIGNGTEREEIERQADEHGVSDSIQFLDPVPPEKLTPHLDAAVASMATLKPGTGYDYAFTSKAYSSLAAGCPVIFAGPGPTGPFLETASAHVRAGAALPHEASAIAEAMRRFADEPLTPAERTALGAWTAREHSMSAVARRVADIIEKTGAS